MLGFKRLRLDSTFLLALILKLTVILTGGRRTKIKWVTLIYVTATSKQIKTSLF